MTTETASGEEAVERDTLASMIDLLRINPERYDLDERLQCITVDVLSQIMSV
jgi:hypothetical protein